MSDGNGGGLLRIGPVVSVIIGLIGAGTIIVSLRRYVLGQHDGWWLWLDLILGAAGVLLAFDVLVFGKHPPKPGA